MTQNCGLTNYPDFSEDPVREGISYLASRGTLTADAYSCNRVSCSYGTGISLCNDSPGSISISGRNVAVEVRDLYAKCDANGLNGRGNAFVDAMQAFYVCVVRLTDRPNVLTVM